MSNHILNSYIGFRNNKKRALVLSALAKQISLQKKARELLKVLLKRKVTTERRIAYKMWQKSTFLFKTCDLMRAYIDGPGL